MLVFVFKMGLYNSVYIYMCVYLYIKISKNCHCIGAVPKAKPHGCRKLRIFQNFDFGFRKVPHSLGQLGLSIWKKPTQTVSPPPPSSTKKKHGSDTSCEGLLALASGIRTVRHHHHGHDDGCSNTACEGCKAH